jgi:serine protease Do
VPVTVMRDKQRKTFNVTVAELDLAAEQGVSERQQPQADQAPTGFGMDIQDVTPDIARELQLPRGRGGAIITRVERNSPAASAGVQPNDVILEVNRQPMTSASQVSRELQRAQPGDTVLMLVLRDGGRVFITMTKK